LGVTLVGVLLAPWVITIFAPGFIGDAERFEPAADMLRITFPYLLLIALTALCGGVLNTYDRFAVPAFTPVLLNLSLIGCALGLSGSLERPVVALAWGVLIAGIVQLGFQLPFMARLRLLPRPRLGWHDEGVRKVLLLMAPVAFAASVAQINLVIDTVLASFLRQGSISWLYYADRLMELPVALVGISLGTVILPRLSRQHAAADQTQFSATLDWAVRAATLLTFPAAAALYVLAEPIIASVFQYGALTAFDVSMAGLALKAYAIGLPGFVGVRIFAPGFFSRQETRTPVRFAVIALGINLTLNLALMISLFATARLEIPGAHAGLALATGVAAIANALMLLRGLLRSGHYVPAPGWLRFSLQLLFANALMLLILEWFAAPVPQWLAWDAMSRIVELAMLVLLGGASFFVGLVLAGARPWRLIRREQANAG
ncbi:MAG: murein biosynthesis integral membrane protein MurJ, partial [Gammaproteobacteria bacterium]